MPEVEVLSRDDILERRDELLRLINLSESELRRRAVDNELTPFESGVLDEIDGLGFLLGA